MRKRTKKNLERRKFSRLKERAVVALVHREKDSVLENECITVSEDIGAGGIRIYAKDDISPGSGINLKFYLFTDPIYIPVKGKVRWNKRVKNKSVAKMFFDRRERLWWIGIQFIDIDASTQIRILKWVKKKLAVNIKELEK